MPRKSPPKPDEKPQFERFIEAAEKAEAAKTDAALPRLIHRLASSKTDATKPRQSPKR